MGTQSDIYTYLIAGGAMMIVLYFAMRLSRSIKKDDERKARMERIKAGPPLQNRRHKLINTKARKRKA